MDRLTDKVSYKAELQCSKKLCKRYSEKKEIKLRVGQTDRAIYIADVQWS